MHDMFGRELKVGDRVTIEYEITHINPGADYCNMTAKSVVGRKPDGMKETFTGNTAVAILLTDPPGKSNDSNS